MLLHRSLLASVILLSAFVLPARASAQEPPTQAYSNRELGVELNLPSDKWNLQDYSQGKAKVLVFSPREDLMVRCSIIHMPALFLPEGLLSREKQIKAAAGDAFTRVAYEETEFLRRPAHLLEYMIRQARTLEWSVKDGDAYLIFQLSAPSQTWDDADERAELEAIRDSLRFSGAASSPEEPERPVPTPAELRQQRQAELAKLNSDFELTHHDLKVRVDPDQRSLQVHDEISIRSSAKDLTEIKLFFSVVSIDDVSAPRQLSWTTQERKSGPAEDSTVRELILTLAEPLSANEELLVTVDASSADFIHEIDQQLVAEVAVMGQVRPRSSYSSHVVYYPVDNRNDASMDITLTVPEGYTAISGGELVETATKDGDSHFRYVTEDRRPRLLPFGFAVGKYIQQSATSAGGLDFSVYGYEGEEPLVSQRVAAGIEAINTFEELMGRLPWGDVRFAHVTPQRKETGVSLPGLILVSDRFFTDFSAVDISDGNLQDARILSLLVVADELSHQWNAYATPWPNELAEGISTFTNAIFIERRHGKDAFVNTIRFCRDAYFQASAIGRDVAIADPDIYQTPAYRGIAFCKTAVVLAMLRDHLGDDTFFRSWRAAFQQFDRTQDGFHVIESAFSQSTGEDLRWFFEQWFYRPGWPKLKIDFQQQGADLAIQVRQVQAGEPYRLDAALVVNGESNEELKHEVQLDSRSSTVKLDCPFAARRVNLDPSRNWLLQVVDEESPR